MRRIVGAAAASVMTLTVLTGCGGDNGGSSGSGSYCDDLQSAKDSFIGLIDNQITQDTFDQLRAALHTLAAEAPSGAKDDWSTFSHAVDTFSAALDNAGLTMDDLRDMGAGQMPGGTDMQTAMRAARSLDSVAVSNAQSAIFRNARSECHIDLNS